MNKNDLFELEITDMGTDGEGIGHYEGMTFFVKDALIGDVILAKCVKLKKNYGYARVESIKTPSAFRVVPECAVHRSCGGCQIQALSYEKQLEFKNEKVRNNLIRLGGFDAGYIDSIMLPVIGMKQPYRYRNKAQFPVGTDKEGNVITGFYAARTHSIIPVEDCLLGVAENDEILARIRSWMKEYEVVPYDEATGRGIVRHILLRYGFTSKEVMVCVIINAKKLPHQEALIDALKDLEGMTSISININMENTNKILGDTTQCIWGLPYISDTIHLVEHKALYDTEDELERMKQGVVEDCDRSNRLITENWSPTDCAVEYHISPQSFYQVNPVQTEKLYSTALEFAELTGKESVWDLYCGIGTISLFLSQRAKQVYGVEIIPQAIEDAKENAKLNGIENAQFFVGKAEEVLPEFYESASNGKHGTGKKANGINDSEMLRPDVIVVDPPRKGCDEKCLETMVKMGPERIVYVSCDSATLARDLKYLCAQGYELKKVQAFDQFAHTMHVESVALMSKDNNKNLRDE